MRRLVKDTTDTFRVKAYAGAQGVLLAFDLDASRKPGLLGFALQRRHGNGPWQWLFNSLTFPGLAHTFPQWGATPSNQAPIQKFRWADYGVPAGTACRYRVHPAYGVPGRVQLATPLEVAVRTEDGLPAGHHVHFNRAVAASQAFSRQFPEVDALLTQQKNLPIEAWPAKPRDWLQNGLLDTLLDFIARAKGKTWALDIAIYEYELQAIVDAVTAAQARGVQLRVLYHAKNGDEQTLINAAKLSSIAAGSKQGRVTSRIFHHKFVLLSKLNAAGVRTPQAVLCGSTNFTENGVYRQANVVHIADDTALAQRYAQLFEQLWAKPADVGAARKWVTINNPIEPQAAWFAGFSPRTGGADLAEFARTIRSASRDLLFATAFALPEDILDALLGAPHDSVLRYGVQNTASRITGYHADRTAEFAATALLNDGLEGWVKEGLKGQKGNLLVHLKAIVTDFTSDTPSVISGSHNLSLPASNGNDENYLIVRGNTDLADRYGLEVLRFYEHYRFRYYAKLLKFKKAQPLAVDDSWTKAYYKPGDLKALSRLRFSGR